MKKSRRVLVFCLLLLLFASLNAAYGAETSLLPTAQTDTSAVPGLAQLPAQPSWQEYTRAQETQLQQQQNQNSQPLTEEKLSQFERYLSVKAVNITKTQLQIIQRFKGVEFQYAKTNIPADKVAVAVKVVEDIGGQVEAGGAATNKTEMEKSQTTNMPMGTVSDVGYLVGSPDAISEAFNILGIKSPFMVSTDLRQLGYDIFNHSSSATFAPVDAVPVGPDYLLGPDDEIRINVWGKVNGEYRFLVDRDGKITMPQIGVIQLAGLTFSEAKGFIQTEFARYYKPSEVQINVGMGRLRTMRVFVVGKVQMPGSYTISSLSTVISALFAAGGPSKVGSMRDIQLKRNGKAVVSLDLYDFILRGDKSKDARLMPEDVIFVPSVGPLVGVAGNVVEPAIYELKGDTTVTGLLEMAGGTNGFAYNNRLQLLRVEDGEGQALTEVNLSEVKKGNGKDFLLRNGDCLTVFPVSNMVERSVHIAGAVKSSGTFGFKAGMTVSQLVTYTGGLMRYADREHAELTRLNITQAGPKTERIDINLGKAMEGDPKYDVPLQEDDYLFVRSVAEWELYRVVSVGGEVLYPGEYSVKKGETMSSLIERAGGFTSRAYLKGAVFTRKSVKELQQRNLDEMINRLEQQLMTAAAGKIETTSRPESATPEVLAAQQRQAFIEKLKLVKAKGRIAIKFCPMDEFRCGAYDITLEDGDSLFIPEKPDQVQVLGSVFNQTAYVYSPDMSVADFISKAGGMTKDADDDEIYVLKVDGTAMSRRENASLWAFRYDADAHKWTRGAFMSRRLDPGDTVVVPIQTDKIAWLREGKDVLEILYQVAVAAGIVLAAFP